MSTDGEPRYRVSRLTERRILGLYGVMCGDGTLPLFTTWRFYRALLVRSLLENAYADGHFVGAREFPLPELERLRLEIERLTKALRIAELKASGTLANNLCPDHRDKQTGRPCLACEIERLRTQLAVVQPPTAPFCSHQWTSERGHFKCELCGASG